MNFREKLGKNLMFFDGGMGTMLQNRGLSMGELPETWNVLHPDEVKAIHMEYLEAGCDIVKSNTFGANHFKCDGSGYTVNELVSAGINVVKEAIKESGKDALTALDIGSIGKLLKPIGDLAFDDAYEAFAEIIKAGDSAGADIVLIETVSDTYEIKAAVLAAKENCNLPIVVTMMFDESGKLLTGADIAAATAMLEGLGVDAIGFNCGLGPDKMLELIPQLTSCTSIPIVVNPNAGLPVVENGQTVFKVGPEEFAASIRKLVESGAQVVGGCCGTTPDHIRQVVKQCTGIKPVHVYPKNETVVSSYTHAVTFGNKPVIIGERINPTGKKRFKQALRENDYEYILKEGIAEEENGAHILDVNVGLPEIDEISVMEKTVTGLQGILDLPLQIDTTDINAMERALRIYNGKAMINSVNGKKESMEAVFPLVKKYGGVVVCLTLDEDGIPDSIEGRVKIAEKIIKRAADYGIDKKDLVIDTLVMTVSTGNKNGLITLGALEKVKKELGVHTVLGVSNISFGLPLREKITTTFFTMAMTRGLSAGIVNPSSEPLMSAYYSYCALIGEDPQCLNYIDRFSSAEQAMQNMKSQGLKQTDLQINNQKGSKQLSAGDSNISLYEAIVKGLGESAAKATKTLLENKESLSIINEDLIPALDTVGKGFEEKTLFLPQLLMSADAAKAAFDTIKSTLELKGGSKDSKGKIVIATVKGDIHDIGKNIVKVLLQNYGYEVIDLGKDVPPELIVNTVIENNVKLVGLSALMTTTVVNMEETIKQLRTSGVKCNVMVGGAVLTQEYADMIGADYYAKDAMESVRYANDFFSSI